VLRARAAQLGRPAIERDRGLDVALDTAAECVQEGEPRDALRVSLSRGASVPLRGERIVTIYAAARLVEVARTRGTS
jgi:hypothetical protein